MSPEEFFKKYYEKNIPPLHKEIMKAIQKGQGFIKPIWSGKDFKHTIINGWHIIGTEYGTGNTLFRHPRLGIIVKMNLN